MKFKHRSGKKRSIGVGTSIGTAISIILCIILAAILTSLILNETLREEGIGYVVPIILLVSSLAGSLIAGKMVEEKKYLVCLMTTGAFIFVLIASTILFFGSQFQNVLLNLAMVLIGGGVSILLNKSKNKRMVRKTSSRRGW